MDPQLKNPPVFSEPASRTLSRLALGAAWGTVKGRWRGWPGIAQTLLRHALPHDAQAHLVRTPLDNPDGLLGVANDLSVESLVAAYERGIYPFAHVPPLKWWAPGKRFVLSFPDFHISKTTRQFLRKNLYRVTFDEDFAGVVRACAGPRRARFNLTWITPRLMQAFYALHEAGYAHSFEAWNTNKELVGGGFGIAIGKVFFTESLFSFESNASKIAFTYFNYHLARKGFVLNDGKHENPSLASYGFRYMPREAFNAVISENASARPWPGRWSVETENDVIASWKPSGGFS